MDPVKIHDRAGFIDVPPPCVVAMRQPRTAALNGDHNDSKRHGQCLNGVTRHKTGAGLPVRALAEVTLDIPAGQVAAVTGRPGSGKSTLLHLAGAMDVPDNGTLTVEQRADVVLKGN
jgi:ABC-type polysaccharide/polyol phosphate transport system ATPase subunit